MATKELEELYRQGKYRELIEVADGGDSFDHEDLLLVGWAHHQLGEYQKSTTIFRGFIMAYSARSEIGESARRGLAHGLLQTSGDFTEVEEIMKEIPFSLETDNVYMNAVLIRARKGETISIETVLGRIIAALETVPYKTVNGHIINNGTLALYEARKQETVKPYLPILPGFIDAAIGIYEATSAAKNHIAGAEFRAAQICEANGWLKLAKLSAEESVELWRELVNSQGGERYRRNLEGAEAQLKKLTQ